MPATVEQGDYDNPRHARALIELTQAFAAEQNDSASADGEDLPELLKLEQHGFFLLARQAEDYLGLAICFRLFSTFRRQPIMYIHDLIVAPAGRRQGIATALLQRIEEIAREQGCCKITLEVLERNEGAQSLYAKLGYGDVVLDESTGRTLHWDKKLI